MKKYDNALKYEIFQKQEYKFLDNLIKNSTTILDIGAHYGYFSIYSLNINKKLLIYALEPVFYKKAKENLINYPNVKVYNLGISTKVGKNTIFVNKEKTMQSSIYNNNFLNKSNTKITCNFTTIDNFIKENPINHIDLMKIDIEGSEFDVLLEMKEKTFKKIDNICLEYHILGKDFKKKFELLVEKLKKIYTNIKILESSYTPNIGYILTSNK